MKPNRKMPELTQEDIDRFWSKVIKSDDPNGCWEFESYMENGYGQFYTGGRKHRQTYKANRIGYFIQTGVDPGNLHVLHHCDNRACIRGSHLFLGDQSTNMIDMVAKGRHFRPEGSITNRIELSNQQVAEIRSMRIRGLSYHRIAAITNLSRQKVMRTILGRNRSKSYKTL